MGVYSTNYHVLTRAEKRQLRENGIRNAMKLALRINAEYGEVDYWTIHLHCPDASPRLRAMIRHIARNDGVVDTPHPRHDD